MTWLYTKDSFKTLDVVFRGGQEYRSCVLFFYPESVVYATDSQYIKNEIKCFNRTTREISIVQSVQGSVIKGSQCGDVALISTAVEPSEVNLDKNAYVWLSNDGTNWKQIYQGTKDCLPSIFQFALFETPQYYTSTSKYAVFSGRAVRMVDGATIIKEL